MIQVSHIMGFCGCMCLYPLLAVHILPRAPPSGIHIFAVRIQNPYTLEAHGITINYKYYKLNVGMAVPKTTETRCRDGSVQARHVIQRLHK